MIRFELEQRGFNNWIPLLGADRSTALPRQPGVYAVSYGEARPKSWPNESCGGWHKKRNPAVDPARLNLEWVDGTDIVYLGRTDRTLAKRIGEFARFGSGQLVGHWGGRLIWQLPRPDLLTIGWLPLDPGLAAERESALLAEFVSVFDRLPFANLRK